MDLREHLKDKKRIVIKIGSSSLTHPETGALNLTKMEVLIREITDLRNQGKRRGAGFIRSHRRGQPGCRFSEKAGANRGKAGLCGHRPGPADDDLSEAFFRI